MTWYSTNRPLRAQVSSEQAKVWIPSNHSGFLVEYLMSGFLHLSYSVLASGIHRECAPQEVLKVWELDLMLRSQCRDVASGDQMTYPSEIY